MNNLQEINNIQPQKQQPIPTQPQMQGIYPTEPIPPYQPTYQQPIQQPTPQQQPLPPNQGQQKMIPSHLAAYEVFKWLKKAQITAGLGIVGTLITAIASAFSKNATMLSSGVISCALIFFIYQIRKEMQRLSQLYNLK